MNVRISIGLIAVSILSALPDRVLAERPRSLDALPAETALSIRIADYRDLRRKLAATSLGQLVRDPQVAPLAESAAGTLLDLLSPASVARPGEPAGDKPTFAAALRGAWRIPCGEIAWALVPAPDRTLSWVLWIDAGDAADEVRQLVDLRLESGVSQGQVVREANYRGQAIRMLVEEQGEEEPQVHLAVAEREQVFLISDRGTTLRAVLETWNRQRPALAADARLKRLQGHLEQSEASTPDAEWFLDPLALYRGWAAESFLELDPLAVPALDLDSLTAIAGRAWLRLERYDLLALSAALVSRPRSGPTALFHLRPGETTVEGFVPAEAACYATFHWDLERTRHELTKLGDSVAGKGGTSRAARQLGLGDWTQDGPLAHFHGRVTLAAWPAADNPRELIRVTALQMRDPQAVREKLAQWLPLHQAIERNGQTWHRPTRGAGCYALLGDRLLIASQPAGLEKSLDAWQKRTPTLAEALDTKLVAGRVSRWTGGAPALVFFGRPDVTVRAWHARWKGLGFDEQTAVRGMLALVLRKTVAAQPDLPDLARITRRLAPYGGFVVDRAETIDAGFFILRRSGEAAD